MFAHHAPEGHLSLAREAHDLGLDLVQAACSGATAENILPSSDPDFSAQPAKDAPNGHWPSQLDTVAYGEGMPNDIDGNLVVLFVGGNDTQYIGDINWCFEHTLGCPHDAYHTADFQEKAAKLQGYVARLVRYIEEKKPAMVVVNEYDSVAPNRGAMSRVPDPFHRPAQSPGLDWLNARLVDLNDAIESGARAGGYSNVRVVKPDFSGHYICAQEPWVAGLGQHDGANAHPTVEGQHTLATLDEQALKP